jgi:methyl-accepting chemotaxis protein
MAKLLARCRIGNQILLLGLIGILGMASIAWINWRSSAGIDRINAAAALVRTAETLADRMRIALLEARRFEKDYLIRPDDTLPQRHAEAIAMAERAINSLAEPLTGRSGELDQLREIRRGMQAYVEKFDSVQNDVQVLGMDENHGLLGQLRTSVHDVEEKLNAIDLPMAAIAMLMMRRHEKDFIVRLDPAYGEQLAKRLPEFVSALDAGRFPPIPGPSCCSE